MLLFESLGGTYYILLRFKDKNVEIRIPFIMLNHRLHALVRSATAATATTRGGVVASRGIVAAGQHQSTPPAAAAAGGTSRMFHSSPPTSLASPSDFHGTTILCVRKNGQVCMMGDGMVSQGSMIIKPNAVKIRQILPKGGPTPSRSDDSDASNDGTVAAQNATLVGFAGTTADAFTLLERLEGKLDEYPGQLSRSCVELAKGWRMDKYLRRLEAALVVADERVTLEITGNGDVLESHDGVISVGSGSPYATGK